MGLMLAFGCLGFIMKTHGYPVVAILLGVILGPILEANFMRAFRISFGELDIFFQSTISQILWSLFALTFVAPPLFRLLKRFIASREGGTGP